MADSTDSAGSETETQAEPPRRFHGTGAVLIFVTIAVLISLVWTQFQQAKNRAKPLLTSFGEAPALLREHLGASAAEGTMLVAYFYSEAAPVEAAMLHNRARELATALDGMGDSRIKILAVAESEQGKVSAVFPSTVSSSASMLPMDSGRILTSLSSSAEIREALFPPDALEIETLRTKRAFFLLVDPEGKIRSFRSAENPAVAAEVLADLGAVVREFPVSRSTPSPATSP